jgi:uncharacterized protein (TIGR03086 family)
MELLDAQGSALSGCDWLVKAIGPGDWVAPTPCTDWTVYDLLNHLVSELLWVPALLSGAKMDDVGDQFDGDVLGADPVGAWTDAATNAREAWLRPGVLHSQVDLSYGLVWRWQGTGIFAPPVLVSADAGSPARLLGMLGRHP